MPRYGVYLALGMHSTPSPIETLESALSETSDVYVNSGVEATSAPTYASHSRSVQLFKSQASQTSRWAPPSAGCASRTAPATGWFIIASMIASTVFGGSTQRTLALTACSVAPFAAG